MLSLTVQTLDGHALQIEVEPTACIKDVRRLLTEQYGLSKCALYLQARQLSMKTLVAELPVADGACLTALTTLGSSVPAPVGRRQQQPVAVSPVGSPVGKGLAAAEQQQQLDTLLPGYASRPNISPVKLQQKQKQQQKQKEQQQQQQQHRKLGPAARDISQLLTSQQEHNQQRQQHEHAAQADAAPDQEADLPSSYTDFEVPMTVNADYSEAVAAAAGLSNGGFIIAGDGLSQQQDGEVHKHGGNHAAAAITGYSRSSSSNSSRKKEGRTLLQQHIMMQHGLKQQQLLAARQQQQQQDQHQQQQQQQQRQHQQQQQQQQQAQQQQQQGVAAGQQAVNDQPAVKRSRTSSCEQQPYIKREPQEQQAEATQQLQQQLAFQAQQHGQQQQQRGVPDQAPDMTHGPWLHEPGSLTRPQQNILLDLPAPAALDQLLLLHCRLDVCYTFLLQQRIQPRWGRLHDMMRQLFPQGDNITLHHLILMSQLAPQAVLLLLPPPQQEQQDLGEQIISLGDEIPWTATLTHQEVSQLQQDLHASAADAADAADTAEQLASISSDGAVAAAGGGANNSRNEKLDGLPAAASALVSDGFDVRDLVVVLVDPGPQSRRGGAAGGRRGGRRKRKSTAAGSAAEGKEAEAEEVSSAGDDGKDDAEQDADAPARADGISQDREQEASLQEQPAAAAPRRKRAQQQHDNNISSTPGPQTVSLSARYGSGSKVASGRRQRLMRLCATMGVWLLHQQFMAGQQQQPAGPQQQQQQRQHNQMNQCQAVVEGVAVVENRKDPHHPIAVVQQQQQEAVLQVPAAATHAASTGGAVKGRKRRRHAQVQQQEGVVEHLAAEADQAAGRLRHRRSEGRTAQHQQKAEGVDEEPLAAVAGNSMEAEEAADAGKSSSRRHGKRETAARRSRTPSAATDKAEPPDVDLDSEHAGVGSCWDPLQQHSWHPEFMVEDILLQDLVSAVTKHRAWLSSQQQQQQVAAGSGTGAGAASAGGGNGSVVLARPTRAMARNKSCTSCEVLNTEQFLQHLKTLSWYNEQVVYIQNMAAREPRYCTTSQPLAPSTLAALSARGIDQLFIHQASAVDALCSKQKHVVIATSTASGKSLCYNIPMLEAVAQDPQACGLFMFPTKALAQDQLRVLRQLMQDAFGSEAPCVEVYDGDTPHVDRADIRERAQLLITNPDMLHQSILPCHKNFTRLLTKLAYVVVDEGHAYRGVFGCHTALVLRRLRRVCERCYGSHPKFVVTSATIANPLEHASLLLGVAPDELLLVDEDGSPHGPKQFVMWNPPLTWEAQQAAAAGGAVGLMSRTEMRGGSYKLKREMARTLARESNAARRRGIALSAAAGVTEEEWAAAVRLGAAGGAAKAFLFNHPPHSPSIAVAAAAAISPKGPAAAPHGRYIQLESQEHKQQSTSQQQQQQQQQAAGAEARAAAEGARPLQGAVLAETRQVARDALAAVAAASNTTTGSRQKQLQQEQLTSGPTPIVRPPSNFIQALSTAGTNPSSSSRRRPSSAVTAEVQREIEEALPARGSFKEKFGAAGTPLDQRRESPIVEMSLLLTEAVMHGLRTIAFCKSRKLCELVAAYTRENLKAAAPHKSNMVKVYRGGYSPAERRQLEGDLHSGALTAVAATNALELGIDVGQLDVTLHLGFPGSVASLWQQAGRAGRRKQSSLSLYVGFDGPLDQHFMQHPTELFQRPIECVQLDPCNSLVMNSHLVCAAKELSLLQDLDGPLFGPSQLAAAIETLTAASLVGRHPHDPVSLCAMHYVGKCSNPASEISLRTIDPERFIIYNTADNSVLEEIESNMAFYEIYDGAIYLFQGHTFICTALNLETRVAYAKPVDVRWYTKVRDHTDIHVTGGHVAYPTAHAALAAIAARRALAGQADGAAVGTAGQGFKQEMDLDNKDASVAGTAAAEAGLASAVKQEGVKVEGGSLALTAADAGHSRADDPYTFSDAVCESCVITVRFMGYFRVHQGSGKVFDAIDLFLPDTQFATQATYLRLPPSARRACQAANIPFREAVHAASHALLNVLPLYMVCNSTDMGTECDNPYDTRFRPERLLLYDKHPGGIGLAAQATPLFPELLQRALDLVQHCSCPYIKGCPCCVQHLDCKNYNAVLNKAGGVLVLKAVLGQEIELTEAEEDAEEEAAAAAG